MNTKCKDTKKTVLEIIKERKTTYEFTSQNIDDAALQRIIEAGRWAPSCDNSQPWHFVIVKNKERIKQLMLTANYGSFHTDPPLMVAFVLPKKKCLGLGFSCYRGKDSMVHDSYMSVGMACLHMALEAKELGIDSCIITPYQNVVKKILNVPKINAVPLILGIGYQNPNAFQKKRDRMDISQLVSYEQYAIQKTKKEHQ